MFPFSYSDKQALHESFPRLRYVSARVGFGFSLVESWLKRGVLGSVEVAMGQKKEHVGRS